MVFCSVSLAPAPDTGTYISLDPYANETVAERDARMEWFQNIQND